MFWNWAKEESTTTGTGTLSLSAVSGWPRIASVAPVGEYVSYAILDSSGNPIEGGIGKVAAGNTLERTFVRATYVSSTYDDSNPGAATLAAGTKTVIATPCAGTFMGAAQAMNSSAGVRVIHSSHGVMSAGDTRGMGTGNTCFYVPFRLDWGCDIDGLMCQVTTAAAGSLRLGLYNVGTDGKPANKIIETADIDTSTTGIKTGSITRRFLPPGWYFTAIASKGVASVVRANGAGSPGSHYCTTPLGYNDFEYPLSLATETLSGGWSALPATATPAGYENIASDFPPRVGLKPA